MAENTIDAIETTLQKTHTWLGELCWEGHFRDQRQAWSVLRAVLHSLRDRLTADEAVHLASEMPMLIRGMYFEGWKPSLAPNRERTRQQFLDSIRESLRGKDDIDPQHAARSVFMLLERKISAGEICDVRRMLPQGIEELWPAVVAGGIAAGEGI